MALLTLTDPENFDLLYASFLSGSLSEAEWRDHLDFTPGLVEWLDEMESLMELTAERRNGR